jgi:predicted glycosyltransferase
MKYIFELNHPKHYYQFKYVMQILKSRGHEISVLARDKDVLLNVLQEEHVGYTVFGKHRKTMLAKVLGTFGLMFKYIAIVKEQRSDVFVSKASWYGSAMAKIFHKKSVIFPDSEVVKVTNRYVVPMCTKVVTPDSFRLDYGSKHYRIKGIFEDCYLSPHVFQADEAVIEKYGLKRPYAVVRFVGWFANHDVGKSGFNQREKEELVQAISKNMNVYISSENDLPDELEPYRLPTPASVIHDVLSFADLYIGDSQTMASEAALLGTPAIRSNSFVGPNDMSNFIMLQEKYGLLYNVAEPAEAISLATDMSKNSRKVEWMEKRDKYYAQVGDCNAQIVELIERI